MYGQGDYNNQFRPGPLEPQFPSFRNAPPPPAPQVYPSGTSGQNQPPPLPPPPPGYHAPQRPQHGHQGHPPYHHGHLSSLLPSIHQASAAPPQPALVQHGRPVPPPPVHHGPSSPSLHHVPPPTVSAPSHSTIGNFGQTYAASPTTHGSLTIPPPYPGCQQPPSYPWHIVPQNLQHGPLPPPPLHGGPNLPRIPAPPPSLQGPITYRPNSVPLNMQVSQHAHTFPPPPPSFIPVAPSTLMPYSQHPIVHAPPPPPLSPPSEPPPPPPSSPPPLPMRASQQEIVSSSGHVVRDNQAMDTGLYHGHITKSVQTENLLESLVDAYDSNLSKDSAQHPSGWIKKGGTVQGHESEEVAGTLLNEKRSVGLPQPPPNPSEEEVARNMTLKESGDPNIGLLDGSEPGSSSAPASDETKCTKQSIQHVQTSEASPDSGLADREMSLSPAVSDMDMEDDVYSPTKDFASHHLVDSVKVQPVPTSKHLLYEERLYAPESPTEQSPVHKISLVEASAGSSKLDIKQEEEDQRFSPGPAFEDLSSASGSPEANDNFDKTIHTSRMTPVENPQLRNPQAGMAKPCVEDVSSFKLLPNYASDDSTDEDVKPKVKDVSPVKASSEVFGSLNNAQDFFSNLSKLNSTEASEVEMLDPTQIQPSQRETSALPCTSSNTDPNSNIEAYGTPSEVQKDAYHHFVSHPLAESETTGLSLLNEQGEHHIVAVNVNPQHISSPGGRQLHQEKDAKEPSTILKVDEFGRLVREGATDSDSDDGGQYSGRLGKRRRRSHSRSPSTQESRWRTTHSPRRRRDRRSRSLSWSPKKERNRSESPPFARSAGHSNEKTWRQRGQPAECFNFMRGRCFRGASCRFLHRDPAADDSLRHYRGKGHLCSEKHQVPKDFAGTMSEKHEATHLKIGISTVEYDAAFAMEEKHKERSGYVDMALSTPPTSNLRAEPAGEGASLAAYEVQSTKADAAHNVDQQVSKDLEDSCQIQLPMERGAHSPNESIQKLVGSSASANLSVETSLQLQSIPEGNRVLAEAKLYEPAHSFQGLVAGWQRPQDDGTNVHPSVRIQDVGSCSLPAQDLMPPVQGVPYLPPKPVSLSQPYPSESHNVAQLLTAESPGPQQLSTRDFQSCTTSADPRLQHPGAMTSGKFPTETSNQHLVPPQPGDQILPLSQSSFFQLKPLQQDTFPSYQPAADLRPLPSTLPRPPQNDLPLLTYVNDLHLRPITSAPDFRPPYQQNCGPLRNEFVLQPPGRPYLPDEPMCSQQVGFFPQPHAAGDSHRPPFWVEDVRPWSFPSASGGDQSLGGEAFAKDPRKWQEERFLYPTNAEGPKSEVLACRPVLKDQHLFSRSTSQLPGRSFNMPVADNPGNSHSQPFATQDSCLYPLDAHSREGNSWVHHYPREHVDLRMHNLAKKDMELRAFGGEGVEGVSSFRDSTYSGQPSVASSSFPLQDGSAPPLSQHLSSAKGPAFPECHETFLTSTRSSLLSVIGRSQVPTTHYNPYASTFEEKPSKFEPQFDLSRVPFGAQSDNSIGSRSFGSSAAPQQVHRESAPGDQYDPLFDSIEPSKKDTLSKFGDGQDGETSFNTVARSNTARTISEPDFVTRLSGKKHKLLNVEENNKQKSVERIVAKPFDSDEFGEATLDAEAGAVENASPMAGDEKSWSPDHPVEANIGVGEVEMDQVHASGKGRKSKDSRSMKLFKIAVAEFVKDVLKPSWRQGNMSKEAFKTIVRKTVDKVSGTMQGHQIPKSKAKIDQYVDSSQRKLTKLVMGYVDKYVKA